MKNIQLIISLALIAPIAVMGSHYQVLDVCIQVKLDQSFRKRNIPSDELEKYGRFGMIESPPFDRYFPVSSALYDDYIDTHQLVEMKKNLLNKVPLIIKSDSNESVVLKQYRFPKFLPKTFIEKLENCQKYSNPFQHVIYKNKNNGNIKTLALRYWIGDVENRDKLYKSLVVLPQAESTSEEDQVKSVISHGCVIDLLELLTLFAYVTIK